LSSIYLEPDDMEAHILRLADKYRKCEELEMRHEAYQTEDAEILLVGYGIVSRVLRSAVDEARKQGVRAGLFRPVTLWPFPSQALANAAARCRNVLTVELSTGQMVEDVRLALNGKVPVSFYGRSGGNVPSVEEIRNELMQRVAVTAQGAHA
jgi:pyruvate/2-oxoacid:ferredoxin oxidoreductase alpha subunit